MRNGITTARRESTVARQESILRRYRGYVESWRPLAVEDEIKTTHKALANLSGQHHASVKYSLKRMEALGIISNLDIHTYYGTSFSLGPSSPGV